MKEFTKSDLKNRMVVVTAQGETYMVVDEYFINSNGFNRLSEYDDNLRTIQRLKFFNNDIVKIYDITTSINTHGKKLIWERSEVKEVTMSEVEEKFGCKVKIVKEW